MRDIALAMAVGIMFNDCNGYENIGFAMSSNRM
jgi:hypothetical protein